jgi:hypothetical protein
MTRRLIFSLVAVLLGCCFLFASPPAQAKDLFSGSGSVCTGDAASSAVCTDDATTKKDQDPLSGKDGLLANITDIVAFAGGVAAVVMIIVGGLRYVTSGSDLSTGARTDADVENAKATITNALIGLAVIVLARELIFFVIGRL